MQRDTAMRSLSRGCHSTRGVWDGEGHSSALPLSRLPTPLPARVLWVSTCEGGFLHTHFWGCTCWLDFSRPLL